MRKLLLVIAATALLTSCGPWRGPYTVAQTVQVDGHFQIIKVVKTGECFITFSFNAYAIAPAKCPND